MKRVLVSVMVDDDLVDAVEVADVLDRLVEQNQTNTTFDALDFILSVDSVVEEAR